jgi:Domain of unknown function (DUF1963)
MLAMRRRERAWSAYRPALKAWQEHVTPFGVDAWRRLAEAEGIAQWIPEFEKDLTIAFRAEPLESGQLAVRSRRGGVPDVPADFVWPHSAKGPWKFLAQVGLEELPDGPHDLPRDGTLAIFDEEPFDHGSRTFYFPADAALVQRTAPSDAEVDAAVPLRFVAYEEIPTVYGCDESTIEEIREYLAGDLLALNCRSDSSTVLWQAVDGYAMRIRAYIEVADLRAREFSRVIHADY